MEHQTYEEVTLVRKSILILFTVIPFTELEKTDELYSNDHMNPNQI